ncbi:MAG: TPM domain-containing protein [Proteobacteria bacterium]|nr:TPM domain-containing protein [Pseudomonadota bacterium]
MKYWLIAFLFIIIPYQAEALDVPQLKGRVNDYAAILSPQTIQVLDSKLSALEQSDSTQVVVLTIPSLEGESLEEFSIKVAETWKIGQKNLDNGAILLVSKNDRKLRIEVGQGLEGKLTDLMSGRIISNEIIPRFKQGDFNGGILAGANAIVSVVKGEYVASRSKTGKEQGKTPIFALLIFLFVITAALSNISKVLGGVTGAILLPVISLISFGGLSILLLGILAIGGFGFGLFSGAVSGGAGRHHPGGFIGGGFGSGGFGGSGFGGGGGGFGGGGSSGGW